MQTARIFNNGNSQAVLLSKNFRFDEIEAVALSHSSVEPSLFFRRNLKSDPRLIDQLSLQHIIARKFSIKTD